MRNFYFVIRKLIWVRENSLVRIYTQNLKDLANSSKPLCPADISPMRGDFDKSRTKKPPLLGEVAAVRLTEGF